MWCKIVYSIEKISGHCHLAPYSAILALFELFGPIFSWAPDGSAHLFFRSFDRVDGPGRYELCPFESTPGHPRYGPYLGIIHRVYWGGLARIIANINKIIGIFCKPNLEHCTYYHKMSDKNIAHSILRKERPGKFGNTGT